MDIEWLTSIEYETDQSLASWNDYRISCEPGRYSNRTCNRSKIRKERFVGNSYLEPDRLPNGRLLLGINGSYPSGSRMLSSSSLF